MKGMNGRSAAGKNRSHNGKYSRQVMRELAKSEEYKMKGEYAQALSIAQKILEKYPDCLAAAEEIADNLLSLHEYESARKIAEFSLSLDEQSYIANYALGFLFLTQGDNGIALLYLQKANKVEPGNPEILRCLGWALFHVDRQIEGIATLERALNLSPDDPMILCDLGVCRLHQDDFDKTVSLFERALYLDPENTRAKECLIAAKKLRDQA